MDVVVKKTEAKVVRNGRTLALYFAAKNELVKEIVGKHVLVRLGKIVLSGKVRRTNVNTGILNISKKLEDRLQDLRGKTVEVEVVYYENGA